MSSKISRRSFLQRTALASAGIAVAGAGFSTRSYSRILGANDRVRFAVIGLHGRGREHIGSIAACRNAVVSHICDVDAREMDKGAQMVQDHFGVAPQRQKDVRRLLESKDIDAITIATPEHWHTPMAMMGLRAGVHVYVEKPPSHNPAEGELLIEAQKKYGRLVQMGNQARSSVQTQEAMQKIHEGVIGRAYFGKAWYSNSRKSIGIGREVPVPDYLDWELWQGPAPRRPYKDNIHPYNWHWFWHWGTGETLNNGTHEVDLCLWALQAGYPNKVSANGGRYHYHDDWEFYDTLVTSFEYKDKLITWEGKSCNAFNYHNRGRGVTIHGTEGTVLIDRNGYEIYDHGNKRVFSFEKAEKDDTIDVSGGGPLTDAHFQNFINAIRSGEKLNSPIDEGNVSVTMLLLSNIAYKTGRTLNLNTSNGQIKKDKKAMKLWKREYERGWEPEV
ncbi:Gfo/Idh/MocA family oxidoreductase [candidate division KSB1 bacterium]|nr:Gfo/Idh/MocA family oxidoreductase [candidate division KSB1 bacterium]